MGTKKKSGVAKSKAMSSFFDDGDVLPSLPPEPELVGHQQFVRRTWQRPAKTEPEQRFQVYVPVSIAKRVRLAAVHGDYSYSYLFQMAIAEYLAKHYPKLK